MLDIFAAYATDEKKEEEGVVIGLGGGASMTVARFPNTKSAKAFQEKLEKNEETLKGLPDKEREELDRKLYLEVLAETVLLNFDGLSFKGKSLKYSKENAMKLLAIRDFRTRVVKEAEKMDNFRAVMEEEAEKN